MGRKSVTHSEDWWENHKPAHILRCSANYKTGDRCRREALPGTSVCGSHGGLVPAVQAKAAARIGMSLDDAVKRLRAMLDDDSVENREKVKILHDLLDRGGLGAVSKVAVGVGGIGGAADPVERLFMDILSDPNALAAPSDGTVRGPKELDPGQAAYDAEHAPPSWEELVQSADRDDDDGESSPLLRSVPSGRKPMRNWPPNGFREADGHLIPVDDEHTVHVVESMSDRPPKWLAEDLERTDKLRKAGLW